jgi:hypothetical protein
MNYRQIGKTAGIYLQHTRLRTQPDLRINSARQRRRYVIPAVPFCLHETCTIT